MKLSGLFSFLSREEPDFEHTEFQRFDDSLQNFMIFYPSHWRYDKTTAVIDGEYTIYFRSGKTGTTLSISVKTTLPLGFDVKKFRESAKDEIEKPSAGVVSKACAGKFKEQSCMSTDYIYSRGSSKFRGEKIIFFTGDRVFSILFICPVSQYDKLKKTFEYVKDSFTVKPKKMMLV